jgi:phosphoribosyl 1,2-cyclic phosphodiesterase
VESACGTKVLIEAGVGPRVASTRLAELGVALRPGELSGIIATHHHGDHFGHADTLAAAFGAPLYLHPGLDAPAPKSRRRKDVLPSEGLGTWQGSQETESIPMSVIPPSVPVPSQPRFSEIPPPPSDSPPVSSKEPRQPIDIRRYDIGHPIRIDDITIMTVQVPHDATQVAIRIDDGTSALGVATDVGRVTQNLVGLLAECDAALVEANHCTEMLAFSEYPDIVKRRVGGGLGHLSNHQTADLAARLVGSRLARLWLGHLSRSNNTPARALETVATRARRIDVDVLPSSSPVALKVRALKPFQLGLPF